MAEGPKKQEKFLGSEKCLVFACGAFVLMMISAAGFVVAFPKLFRSILQQVSHKYDTY